MNLPPELRSKVFDLCKQKDLTNMALVSKKCLDEVRPYIWSHLLISWYRLRVPNDFDRCKEYFKYTRAIQIGHYTDPSYETDSPFPLRQGYVNFSFCNIINSLNPENMEALILSDFLVADGLQLASLKLPFVTYLDLHQIKAVGNSWEYICTFHYLRQLEIHSCNVASHHFRNIKDLFLLRTLKISDCPELDGSFLAYVNKMSDRLTVFEFVCCDLEGSDYATNLNNLKHIETLALKSTWVHDDFFMALEGKLEKL